jgi:hypothetical protein
MVLKLETLKLETDWELATENCGSIFPHPAWGGVTGINPVQPPSRRWMQITEEVVWLTSP